MDMPPTVNTVSTFPMAVPKSSPTTLPMPMEDMLLMSNTKVLLNTQKLSHTTQLSQPHTTPNCCTRIKLNVFIQNIYSIRINTENFFAFLEYFCVAYTLNYSFSDFP